MEIQSAVVHQSYLYFISIFIFFVVCTYSAKLGHLLKKYFRALERRIAVVGVLTPQNVMPSLVCHENATHSHTLSFWRMKQLITRGKVHLNNPCLKEIYKSPPPYTHCGRGENAVLEQKRLNWFEWAFSSCDQET